MRAQHGGSEAFPHLDRDYDETIDHVSAENSMGFHASQEAARILGEAIEYGRLGQLALTK